MRSLHSLSLLSVLMFASVGAQAQTTGHAAARSGAGIKTASTLYTYDSVAAYDDYAYKLKESGKIVEPKKPLLELLQKLRPDIDEAAQLYGVDSRAIAGAVLAENTMNVGVDDDVQNWLTKLNLNDKAELITGGGYSIGLGQIYTSTAIKVEPMMAKLENRPERSYREVEQALLDPRECLKYIAAELKKAQDAYQAEGFDISDKPEILTTIYNLGLSRNESGTNRAQESKAAGNEPRPNYFGYFVYHHKDLLDKNFSGGAKGKPNMDHAALDRKVNPIASPPLGHDTREAGWTQGWAPRFAAKWFDDDSPVHGVDADSTSKDKAKTLLSSLAEPVAIYDRPNLCPDQINDPSRPEGYQVKEVEKLWSELSQSRRESREAGDRASERIKDKLPELSYSEIVSVRDSELKDFLLEEFFKSEYVDDRLAKKSAGSEVGSHSGAFRVLDRVAGCNLEAWMLVEFQDGSTGWASEVDMARAGLGQELVKKFNEDCDAKKQWTCEQAIKKHLGGSASFGSYSGNLLNLRVPASMLASGDAGRSYDYTKARGVFVYLEKLSCVESIYTNDARVLAGVRDSNKTRLLSAEAGLSLSVKIVEGCGESLATEPKKGWR